MAVKKKIANKAEKATVANKAAKPAAIKPDLSKLSDSNTVVAIVDSKHMKKGMEYRGIGRWSTQILVNKGLVKIV